MNASAITTKKTFHTTEEGGVLSSLYARGVDLGLLMVNLDGSAVLVTAISGANVRISGASEGEVIEKALTACGAIGKRTLTPSAGSFDQETTFFLEVDGYRGKHNVRCKLQNGYEKADDGIYWAMNTGATIKAHYTAADRRERNRLMLAAPVKHGDIVTIEGEDYRVNVLGDYSNAATFEKVAA